MVSLIPGGNRSFNGEQLAGFRLINIPSIQWNLGQSSPRSNSRGCKTNRGLARCARYAIFHFGLSCGRYQSLQPELILSSYLIHTQSPGATGGEWVPGGGVETWVYKD